MVSIKKDNGETFEAELICYFELVDVQKKYLFYTLNETVENGLIKMYVTEVSAEGVIVSQDMTDEEWLKLKSIMKSMLKEENDENIKYLEWEAK